MLESLKVVLILCRARVQVQILAQQVRRHLSLALHLHKVATRWTKVGSSAVATKGTISRFSLEVIESRQAHMRAPGGDKGRVLIFA